MTIPKALFLDRDGTLIVEKNYLSDPKQIELEKTAIPALKLAQKHKIKLILVTNQSGIGRGYFTEECYKTCHQALVDILQTHHIKLDASYFCPHHPQKGKGIYKKDCSMRKPSPGMLLKGIQTFQLPPSECVMIGDKLSDISAGKAAKMKTILLTPTPQTTLIDPPDFQANTLMEALSKVIQP